MNDSRLICSSRKKVRNHVVSIVFQESGEGFPSDLACKSTPMSTQSNLENFRRVRVIHWGQREDSSFASTMMTVSMHARLRKELQIPWSNQARAGCFRGEGSKPHWLVEIDSSHKTSLGCLQEKLMLHSKVFFVIAKEAGWDRGRGGSNGQRAGKARVCPRGDESISK